MVENESGKKGYFKGKSQVIILVQQGPGNLQLSYLAGPCTFVKLYNFKGKLTVEGVQPSCTYEAPMIELIRSPGFKVR